MPIAHSHADACGSHDLIIIHTVAKGDRVLQRDIPDFAEAFEAFCLGGILFNDIGPFPARKQWKLQHRECRLHFFRSRLPANVGQRAHRHVQKLPRVAKLPVRHLPAYHIVAGHTPGIDEIIDITHGHADGVILPFCKLQQFFYQFPLHTMFIDQFRADGDLVAI